MDFLNKMFDTLDSDKNGSISEAELIDVFKKFDTDGKSRGRCCRWHWYGHVVFVVVNASPFSVARV